jgi:hypothetical protein
MEINNKNIEIENNDDNKKIFKCLKSYLTAKKYYESDSDKSLEYFKQCIKILNDLREKNIKITKNLVEIIDETETECSKYITQAITNTLDEPSVKKVKSFDTDNELFELIEIGDIHKLKTYSFGDIDFNITNEFGLTPLHYAIRFGDTTFLRQAFKLGAGIDQSNKFGHTLLEYACLEKDPNMINFLMAYGADMKKHLEFREGKKYFNNTTQIDIALIEKKIMESSDIIKWKNKHLDFLLEYIKPDEPIDIDYCNPTNSTIPISKITFCDFLKKLDFMVNNFPQDYRDTFIKILKEEFVDQLTFKLGCPTKPIELILYNLVPFLETQQILRLNWLVSLEVKYLILKILKNKIRINTKELKQELVKLLYLSYIKPEIIPEGLIQIIVLQWVYKIKV